MKNATPNATDTAPLGSILALVAKDAAAALAGLHLGKDMAKTLDTYYGKGKWFVFWDEDLSGRPIRGTISLAFGKQTMVIG